MTTAGADALCVGGLQRFTTLDYPGALAAVVFVRGCPWRCGYCHNPQLQRRHGAEDRSAIAPSWPTVRAWLQRRRSLLDAVVFSGGEPTLDPALPDAMAQARALGFRIGLHTAGLAPRRLCAVLPQVDWVGLDIKAPLNDGLAWGRITGCTHNAMTDLALTGTRRALAVRESLALLVKHGGAFECRTTVHPNWLSAEAVERMGWALAREGVRRMAVQMAQPVAGTSAQLAVSPDPRPYAEAVARMRTSIAHVELRQVHAVDNMPTPSFATQQGR